MGGDNRSKHFPAEGGGESFFQRIFFFQRVEKSNLHADWLFEYQHVQLFSITIGHLISGLNLVCTHVYCSTCAGILLSALHQSISRNSGSR